MLSVISTMNVCIVGTGYVGLTTGARLAYLGHNVTCLDLDGNKISQLRRGEGPIHEPGLVELLSLARPDIRFTTEAADGIPEADVIFVAVGTPALPAGNPVLQY